MKMLVMLLSTIFLKTAVSQDVIIQRHFKGDIFTRGKSVVTQLIFSPVAVF